MRQISVDGQQEIEVNERTFTVYYHAAASMAYWPAQTSGPVERCYPDESECDIQSVNIYQLSGTGDTPVDLPFQSTETMKKIEAALDYEVIEDQLWEAFHQGD